MRTGDFQRTDKEVKLLLSIMYEYKVKKKVKGIDWESIKNKCNNILEAFSEVLLSNPEDNRELSLSTE